MIGTDLLRVEQDFRGGLPLLDVEDRLLLVRAALGEERAAAADGGHGDGLDLDELGQAPLDAVAAGTAIEHRSRVGVLRVDPGADLGCLLVLEPAVRIGDGHAVQRVHHLRGAGRGRRRRIRGVRACGGPQDHAGDTKERDDKRDPWATFHGPDHSVAGFGVGIPGYWPRTTPTFAMVPPLVMLGTLQT